MPVKRTGSAASEAATSDASRASNYDWQWGSLIGVLLILDSASVLGSLVLAYTLRISSGLLNYSGPQNEQVYRVLVWMSVPIWLALFAMMGLYRRDTLLGGVGEYQRVVRACTAGVMAFIVLSFLWHDIEISRGWLSISWVLACVLVGVERFMVRRAAYSLRSRGWFTARVLVVGANDQGIAIACQWSQSPTSGMQVVGFLDDFKPMGTPVVNSLKVIGRPTALDELARQTGANEVVVVPNAVAWETFEEIIARANVQNGYALRLSPGFYELLTTSVTVTNKAFVPLLTINETRLVGVDAVLKSLLDYGLGLAMLIVALPVMGVIALRLKLNRRDKPVLAHYQTIGQCGATFKMFKFNTRIDSVIRAIGQSRATAPIPPGVSRLERLLYRRGLDKLPQLFNVLAGQMSLIGPRPRVVDDQADAQQVQNLQTVKPGMLGPWTLPDSCSSGDEIQDELYYVRNWTIWLDLHVLFRAVLNGISAGGLARPTTLKKQAVRSVGVTAVKGSNRSSAVCSQSSRDRRELP